MAIIVEDGTGMPTANSLVSEADLLTYASARGIDLVGEDMASLLVKAMDYFLSREPDFQGSRSSEDQALPFPRTGMTIYCRTVVGSTIPVFAKQAQMQLAIEVFESGDIQPSVMTSPIEREKVEGAVERKFMTPRQMSNSADGTPFQPIMPKVESLLYPLLRGNECPGSGASFLKAVRV